MHLIGIDNETLYEMIKCAKDTRVDSITITHGNLTDDCIDTLVDFISNCAGLVNLLDISYNKFTIDGLKKLILSVFRDTKKIKVEFHEELLDTAYYLLSIDSDVEFNKSDNPKYIQYDLFVSLVNKYYISTMKIDDFLKSITKKYKYNIKRCYLHNNDPDITHLLLNGNFEIEQISMLDLPDANTYTKLMNYISSHDNLFELTVSGGDIFTTESCIKQLADALYGRNTKFRILFDVMDIDKLITESNQYDIESILRHSSTKLCSVYTIPHNIYKLNNIPPDQREIPIKSNTKSSAKIQ